MSAWLLIRSEEASQMTAHARAREMGTVAHIETSFDPFRAHHPSVLVHDVSAQEFDQAWAACSVESAAMHCPICHTGAPAERGRAPWDQRAWVRFSCGDLIAQEQSAG